MFSNNIEKLRLFLAQIEGKKVSQASMAERVNVTQQTWSKWVRGEHGQESYLRVSTFVNQYFLCDPPVTLEEVRDQDLLDLIRDRAEGLRPDKPLDKKSYSRWTLRELLKDIGNVRMLKVDDDLRSELESLCADFRNDLEKDDWAAVARAMREGRREDLWVYYENEKRTRFPVFFKSDRQLTEAEVARFQREVLDKVIDEFVDKIRKERKNK